MTRLLAIDDRVTQKKNRFTNPGMEKSAGGTNVERWRNLCLNPAAVTTAYWYAWGGSGGQDITLSVVAGRRPGSSGVRGTWPSGNTGPNGGVLTSAYWYLITPGKTYSFSAYVQPATTRTIDFGVIWFDSVGAQIKYDYINQSSCPAGQWTRKVAQGLVAPPGAILAQPWYYTMQPGGAGDWISVCDPTITETPYITPYFDGSYADSAFGVEATTSWVGTAHASASTLNLPTPNVTVYTNLAVDPQPNVLAASSGLNTVGWDSSRWFGPSGGAGTYSLVTGASDGPLAGITRYVRKTWTTAPSSNGDTGFNHTTYATSGTYLSGLSITAGVTYTFSSYVRPSATKTSAAAMQVVWRDAAGAVIGSQVSGVHTTITAGVWTRLVLTATAPAGAVKVQINSDVDLGTAWAVGQTLDGCALMITATPTVVPYFDGTYGSAYDPDMVCSWSGTAHASTSLAQGVGPSEVGTTANAAAIQSIQWGKSGQSMRIIPISTSNTTYASIGGLSGALRLGIKPGRTYTIRATLRLPSPLGSGLHPLSRKIVVFTKAGAAAAIQHESTQPPNTAGEHQVSLVFTVPSDADEAYVRVYNGSDHGRGESWWDDVTLVEGKYDGPYIDGSAPKAKWLGSAHASESVGYPIS